MTRPSAPPARQSPGGDDADGEEAGKLADLVLLDGNPVEEIRRTRSIAGVFVNGRFLDRAALDSLLAVVQTRASGRD